MRLVIKSPSPVFENTLLALLSGVLLTAAFPPGHLSFLSWVAVIPLLFSIKNSSWKSAFRLGFFAGLIHYLTLIYWIVVVLGRYGNLNIFLSVLGLLLLSLYLSLYLGVFSALAASVRHSRFELIFLPAFWVALEYLRTYLFSGFPWCLLGYTQYKELPLIQVADLFGVYGISFFIILINTFLFTHLCRDKGQSRRPKWEMILLILVTGAILTYGYHALSRHAAEEGARSGLKTAIVQANIDQSLKWDPAYQTETLRIYEKLTRQTSSLHPKLVVWPETAVPFFFQDHLRFARDILALSRETGALLLFGSPAYERQNGVTRYYNRAYLIDPGVAPGSGNVSRYDKVHLVPFGEYVPFKKFIPFIDNLVQAAGDFARGSSPTPLTANDIAIGVLICFEAIFPELARDRVRQGATVLVNLTNDAWFGMSSAPYQHLSMAVFRSVETRRAMVRAANTGFSAFINPCGDICLKSELFSETILHHAVTTQKHLTPYARFGDLFALALTVISIIQTGWLLLGRWRKRK